MARFKDGKKDPLMRFKSNTGLVAAVSGVFGFVLTFTWSGLSSRAQETYYDQIMSGYSTTIAQSHLEEAQTSNDLALMCAILAFTVCFIAILARVLANLAVAYKLSQVTDQPEGK